MSVSDAKRLKALETEIARLKKLLVASVLENEVARARGPFFRKVDNVGVMKSTALRKS
jgi:hypothetical protein